MPLTNDGAEVLAGRLIGEEDVFDTANAYIGVGDSSTSFDKSQSDLDGENTRSGMDSDYPQRSENQLTFRATFGDDEANFVWEEWGIFNAETGGYMLNRVVEHNGEKVSGHVWEFTVSVTIQA